MNTPAACPHCGTPRAAMIEGLHLPPSAATPSLQIGQLVIAHRLTAVCRPDELDGWPGWTVQFRAGGQDGWNPCQAELFLIAGQLVPGLTDYAWLSGMHALTDLKSGLFDAAFDLVDDTAAAVRAAHREGTR